MASQIIIPPSRLGLDNFFADQRTQLSTGITPGLRELLNKYKDVGGNSEVWNPTAVLNVICGAHSTEKWHLNTSEKKYAPVAVNPQTTLWTYLKTCTTKNVMDTTKAEWGNISFVYRVNSPFNPERNHPTYYLSTTSVDSDLCG